MTALIFKKSEGNISLKEQTPIKDNIVLKAAELVKDLYSVKEGVSIELIKSIPDQKGLGGGSSDAAATIIGLNKLWNLKIIKQRIYSILLLNLDQMYLSLFMEKQPGLKEEEKF